MWRSSPARSYLLSANLVSLVWGGQDGKMYVTALFPGALWLLVTALDRHSWLRLRVARASWQDSWW